MSKESNYRKIVAGFALAMLAVRLYYQRKALAEGGRAEVQPQGLSLFLASGAALTNIVFGLAYLARPSAWRWSYARFPDRLRRLGAGLLAAGTGLLWAAHHHLAENFSGVVVLREGQQLVTTGPYARIRHPIYTAYLLNYLGGGLLAGSWVLTLVPAGLYAGMAILRMPQEEALLRATFGEAYDAYQARTDRLLPGVY